MRKSKREIERGIDGLGSTEEFSLQEYMWADLKAAHDGRLTQAERRLLDDPETHLSSAAVRRLRGIGGER